MANDVCLWGGRAQLVFRAKASYRSNTSNLAVKVVMANGTEGGVNVPLRDRSRVDAHLGHIFTTPTHAPKPTVDNNTPIDASHGRPLRRSVCPSLNSFST